MYDFFEGTIESKTNDAIVLNVSGVGYKLLVSKNAIDKAPPVGKSCKILAQLLVREDAMVLLGFIDAQEREMFNHLVSVTKVGAKLALSALSALTPTELAIAVAASDVSVISSVPGIGKKSAERIIMELKEKVSSSIAFTDTKMPVNTTGASKMNDAMQALVALGYSSSEAMKALSTYDLDDMSVEQAIMQALKLLGTSN